MAIGNSGRGVIDFDAAQKQVLHQRLQQRELSLRGWFLDRARQDGLLDADGTLTPSFSPPLGEKNDRSNQEQKSSRNGENQSC